MDSDLHMLNESDITDENTLFLKWVKEGTSAT